MAQIPIIALVISMSTTVFAQNKSIPRKYWIEFTDKNISPAEFCPGNPLFERTRALFSNTALSRRTKLFQTTDISKLITIDDAPIAKSYLDSLSALGISISSRSRWTNAVSVALNNIQFETLKKYTFVKAIHPVLKSETTSIVSKGQVNPISITPTPTDSYCGYDTIINHYGESRAALYGIDAAPLHMMGFDGSGVRLGLLDVGFRWRSMLSTYKHHVIGEYDFVNNDSITAAESNDQPGSDGHGSNSLSAATGFYLDSMIGPAYNADLLLAKTENTQSETPAEEDNYTEALEWMESFGVDIASSSLGYRGFDSGFTSYRYEDMDGKTAISTRAAAHAARLGVLICTASGNYGQQNPPSLIAPSDADSILSCGALFDNDTIVGFSSNGPTSDGRIKPDICALGNNVRVLSADNTMVGFSGTSASTPLIAGACALIMQAHPEASAQKVRTAILQSGRLFEGTEPNNVYGYGKIDAYNAALKLGTIIGKVKLSRQDSIYSVCVPIAANNGIQSPRIVFALVGGPYSGNIPLTLVTDSLIYSATFPALSKGTFIRYYIETRDGADTITTSPRTATDSVFSFYIGDTIIAPLGTVSATMSSTVVNIYPNPSSGVVFLNNLPIHSASEIIVDNVGRKVFENTDRSRTINRRFDLSNLSNGSYRLVITSAGGEIHEYPIVIAK